MPTALEVDRVSGTCPACGAARRCDGDECGACGVLMSRWKKRAERPARLGEAARPATAAVAASSTPPERPPRRPQRPPPPAPAASSVVGRVLLLVVVAAVGGLAVVEGYKRFRDRPSLSEMIEAVGSRLPTGKAVPTRLALELAPDADLDASVALPGGPSGLAWAGQRLFVANRTKPWGILRITIGDDGALGVEKVPVIEKQYDQTMGLDFVAWNGQQLVGHTTGSWFGKGDAAVFTFHDPETLQILRTAPAPPKLGALVWDGEGYWAATRRDTADRDDQAAFLYRLSPELQVTARYPPPGVGCQGLGWDGRLLYFADVFDDAVHVLDVKAGEPPSLRLTWNTPFSYPSGIGFDGEHLWVAEYQDDRLHRVSHRLRQDWLEAAGLDGGLDGGGLVAVERPAAATGAPLGKPLHKPVDLEEVAELKRKLRSDDWGDRMQAEMRLKELRQPIEFDREQNSFERDPEPTDVVVRDWQVELEDGELYASWDIAFGEQLLTALRGGDSGGTISIPLFIHIETTVQGGGLEKPVERTFEPEGAEDRRERVLLASGLGPGEYRVSLFFHVQYVGAEGQASILNHSTTSLEVSR